MDSSLRSGALLEQTIGAIGPLDSAAMEHVRSRQDQFTKPAGSLGRLETLSIQLAGIQASRSPSVARKVVFVFAGDHGVVEEGLSAYPAAVTAQMALNFLHMGPLGLGPAWTRAPARPITSG